MTSLYRATSFVATSLLFLSAGNAFSSLSLKESFSKETELSQVLALSQKLLEVSELEILESGIIGEPGMASFFTVVALPEKSPLRLQAGISAWVFLRSLEKEGKLSGYLPLSPENFDQRHPKVRRLSEVLKKSESSQIFPCETYFHEDLYSLSAALAESEAVREDYEHWEQWLESLPPSSLKDDFELNLGTRELNREIEKIFFVTPYEKQTVKFSAGGKPVKTDRGYAKASAKIFQVFGQHSSSALRELSQLYDLTFTKLLSRGGQKYVLECEDFPGQVVKIFAPAATSEDFVKTVRRDLMLEAVLTENHLCVPYRQDTIARKLLKKAVVIQEKVPTLARDHGEDFSKFYRASEKLDGFFAKESLSYASFLVKESVGGFRFSDSVTSCLDVYNEQNYGYLKERLVLLDW